MSDVADDIADLRRLKGQRERVKAVCEEKFSRLIVLSDRLRAAPGGRASSRPFKDGYCWQFFPGAPGEALARGARAHDAECMNEDLGEECRRAYEDYEPSAIALTRAQEAFKARLLEVLGEKP